MISPLNAELSGFHRIEPTRVRSEDSEATRTKRDQDPSARSPFGEIVDEVRFSSKSLAAAQAERPSDNPATDSDDSQREGRQNETSQATQNGDRTGQGSTSSESDKSSQLSPEEERSVRELQARDREVRAHEQAHQAAAGNLAVGGPSYQFQTGPDGRRYAVGGEVNISIRDGRTPEETVSIARQAQRAALAPAEPSSQDRKVAAAAAQKASKAAQEAHQKPKPGSGEDGPHEIEASPAEVDEGPRSSDEPLEGSPALALAQNSYQSTTSPDIEAKPSPLSDLYA